MARIRITLEGRDASRWMMAKAWDRDWWLELQGVDPHGETVAAYYEELDRVLIEGDLWKPKGWPDDPEVREACRLSLTRIDKHPLQQRLRLEIEPGLI